MINWLRKIIFQRSRHVYVYWDGRKIQRGDPIVLYRNMLAEEDYRDDDFELMKLSDPEIKLKSIGNLAAVCRRVFDLRKFEDDGPTELECVQILREFRSYAGVQKKSGGLPPTSPLPTGTEPSGLSTEKPNTSEDSASISMPNESSLLAASE